MSSSVLIRDVENAGIRLPVINDSTMTLLFFLDTSFNSPGCPAIDKIPSKNIISISFKIWSTKVVYEFLKQIKFFRVLLTERFENVDTIGKSYVYNALDVSKVSFAE